MDNDQLKRGYYQLNNKWRHVYILDSFTQKDIFGAEVTICVVKLTKRTKEKLEVEAEKILDVKPRAPRKRRIQ